MGSMPSRSSKMQISILQEEEKALLSRREIGAEIVYSGSTPKEADVKTALAQHLKANDKLLVIKHIYPAFGFQKAKVILYHYMSEEDKLRYEPLVKQKKVKQPKAQAKKE